MAVTALDTIKNWFKTHLKPTQAQFWAMLDSFRHKSEKVPVADIEGLDALLIGIPAQSQVDGKLDKGTYTGTAQTLATAIETLNGLVDDLQEADVLTAGQITGLQTQITAINTLLTSDDVNLDTVQELVDAIKTVETSLSTILVNDLTTGGTTKALTAEMGKSLKALIDALTTALAGKEDTSNKSSDIEADKTSLVKYPKVKAVYDWGVGLFVPKTRSITINGTTQDLSSDRTFTISSGVTTTVKTITSANLTTQDTAGFVAYINALAVVLVVSANEIVEYQLSDTGRVFKLLLRGRSFGTGQPAITTADVEEITLWMQKDLKLTNYPNTRNDGVISTNKVLSTDASGNLKMYSIATAPAPYLYDLIPDSYLPSNTGNFVLKGAFFTPTMTVTITGQTVNYIIFISDNEVRVNVTTGSAEGQFDVTLNNGLSSTYSKRFLVVLGTVFTPVSTDWINKTGNIDVSEGVNLKATVANTSGSAEYSITAKYAKNYRVYFDFVQSPLTTSQNNRQAFVRLQDSVTGTWLSVNNWQSSNFSLYQNSTLYGNLGSSWVGHWLEKNGSTVYLKNSGGIVFTFSNVLANDMRIIIGVNSNDIYKIKYVELA